MPKYFDLTAIAKELPDYAYEGDVPGNGTDMYPFANAMLSSLDGERQGDSDAEHVVNCFNDALAGILHGLSVRVAPGQMKAVVDHLIEHASFTMRWIAQNEDNNDDDDKRENEQDIRDFHSEP
jgi:hypothetical protein